VPAWFLENLSKDRSFLRHKINIEYQNGLVLTSLAFETKGGKYSVADSPR